MTSRLEIHPASEEERLQAYRNVFDVWGGGNNLETHIQLRLASAQHNRALWFVGCLNGKVATSLGCYPMQFRINGQTEQGIAIGSVHTLKEYRGMGYAPQLIQWVEEYQQQRGTTISLLYSDISPDYYARMGYQLCPAWEGWISPQQIVLEKTSNKGSLIPISPSEERSTLQQIYNHYHSQFEISISRNDLYWDFLLQKGAGDDFCYLESPNGKKLGYVHLGVNPDRLTLRDWAFTDHSSDNLTLLLNTLIEEGNKRKANRVGGWLPDNPSLQTIIPIKKRHMEITMLKRLPQSNNLKSTILSAAGHFQEIDHV